MTDDAICFKQISYSLKDLLTYIDIGDIGLPEIQRPFIWKNTKVRDLLDSMFQGFPVGYFLFWANETAEKARGIGPSEKQHDIPNRLIIDGQQRLTSLYAVFRDVEVLDSNYRKRKIEIAFHPRDGRFDVADNSIRRSPEWIPDVSVLWHPKTSNLRFINEFINKLSERGELSAENEDRIASNIERLIHLESYPFTALEIAEGVDEEKVADIFVRINNQGKRLNQSDFILTLLSVFRNDCRIEIERFCEQARKPAAGHSSSFNHFIEPEPSQLLRVIVALAFRRGRLKAVYQVLHGKSIDTGKVGSDESRDAQFDKLAAAQREVLNLTHWHQFWRALVGAGFRSRQLVSSNLALMFAYAFYLLGKVEYHVPEEQLQKLMGRWFFFISLTSRYSSSPETRLESDLNDLRGVSSAEEFTKLLENKMESALTGDFWEITLPASMESSSSRSPEFFAFVASLNTQGAPVLFSRKKVQDMLDPAVVSTKEALERHHLFPKAWLVRNGIDHKRDTDQIANFALIEWSKNIEISDDDPSAYVPALRAQFSSVDWQRMSEAHALPDEWEEMDYFDFLKARRLLIAQKIRAGYECLER